MRYTTVHTGPTDQAVVDCPAVAAVGRIADRNTAAEHRIAAEPVGNQVADTAVAAEADTAVEEVAVGRVGCTSTAPEVAAAETEKLLVARMSETWTDTVAVAEVVERMIGVQAQAVVGKLESGSLQVLEAERTADHSRTMMLIRNAAVTVEEEEEESHIVTGEAARHIERTVAEVEAVKPGQLRTAKQMRQRFQSRRDYVVTAEVETLVDVKKTAVAVDEEEARAERRC